jgi:hypothetical protein
MQPMEEIMAFCDDMQNKTFVVCRIAGVGNIVSTSYPTPYHSEFMFDTIQVHNHIYFCGGGFPEGDKSGHYLRTLARVMVQEEGIVIDRLGDMGTPRASHTVVALDKRKLFVLGGMNNMGLLASCEEYDVASNVWKQIAPLHEKKKIVSACTFCDCYVFVFGGDLNPAVSSRIELLDTEKPGATWQFAKIAAGHELWAPCILQGCIPISDDWIMIFGGLVERAERATTLFYSPHTGTIQPGPNLRQADAFSRAKPLRIGPQIIAVGMMDGDLHVFNTTAKVWDIKKKTNWNPKIRLMYKADTC